MSKKFLEKAISNFSITSAAEPRELLQLLRQGESKDLNRSLIKVLNSKKAESVMSAHQFVLDLILNMPAEVNRTYSSRIADKRVIKIIEEHIFSQDSNIVHSAVATLGRIGSRKSLKKFVDLFYEIVDEKPLLLTNLIFEIVWLKYKPYKKLILRMIESKSFLTRWAAVSILINYLGSTDTRAFAKKELNKLSKDENSYVRNEANSAGRKLSKNILEFENTAIQFQNHLYFKKKHTYTPKDFELFLGNLSISASLG